MNILLIGSGAREHAIAKAVAKSPQKTQLFCLSNAVNPGIDVLCSHYEIGSVTDVQSIVSYAEEKQINLAIIGPEAPLEVGVADSLKERGIFSVGPTKNHAQLETSKGFTRDLLEKYNIPGNPFFKRFTTMNGVQDTLNAWSEKFVIKADGLCGGKGVVIWGDHFDKMEQAYKHCQELVNAKKEFVIEEKINGQEFSVSYTHLTLPTNREV